MNILCCGASQNPPGFPRPVHKQDWQRDPHHQSNQSPPRMRPKLCLDLVDHFRGLQINRFKCVVMHPKLKGAADLFIHKALRCANVTMLRHPTDWNGTKPEREINTGSFSNGFHVMELDDDWQRRDGSKYLWISMKFRHVLFPSIHTKRTMEFHSISLLMFAIPDALSNSESSRGNWSGIVPRAPVYLQQVSER